MHQTIPREIATLYLPVSVTHTHARRHAGTRTHNTHTLPLFWQFCVSAKTTGTVDISLWLRFHSLWSQPCCLAFLKGHCCCLSKSQQKHTMQCYVCVRVCAGTSVKVCVRENGKVCVYVCVRLTWILKQELSVDSNWISSDFRRACLWLCVRLLPTFWLQIVWKT